MYTTYHEDGLVSGQRHQTEPVPQILEEGSVRKVGYALVTRQKDSDVGERLLQHVGVEQLVVKNLRKDVNVSLVPAALARP